MQKICKCVRWWQHTTQKAQKCCNIVMYKEKRTRITKYLTFPNFWRTFLRYDVKNLHIYAIMKRAKKSRFQRVQTAGDTGGYPLGRYAENPLPLQKFFFKISTFTFSNFFYFFSTTLFPESQSQFFLIGLLIAIVISDIIFSYSFLFCYK